MKLVNSSGQKNERRQKAILRLQEQLKTGLKPAPKPVRGIDIVLDEDDVKRIKKEIQILQSRIISDESAILIRTKKYRAAR